MRVVFISRHTPPAYSGAGRAALSYAKFLKRLGVAASILAAKSTPGTPELDTIEGVPIHRLRCNSNGRWDQFTFYLRCAFWLLQNRRELDVIHFAYMPTYWYPVFLIAKLLKKSVFLTMTLYGSDDLHSISKNRLGPLDLFLYRRSRRILGISEKLIQVSEAHVANKKLIAHLTYPVDLSTFRPPERSNEIDRLRRAFHVPSSARVVIFSGSIVQRKGVDLLIESWPKVVERLPNAILYLIGPRTFGNGYGLKNEDFSYHLDLRIQQLGITDSVLFLGDRAEQIPDLLRIADALVLPSREEGLPLALLEAMATGLPCIICDQPWVPKDLIHHGETGLVCLAMPDSLADSIITALSDQQFARNMGTHARAYVEKNHNPIALSERLLKLYASSIPT
jgi:glycosyltransferase involved in cell wall biosynthesis